ncbi:MAG: nucleoside triphosphate pyrophosphohydrolase [Oscillospiraceae bacterium]|nr:nucleoside triphosphate pyrophosphohydrolase [Oscillospiraceae bacterium]
MFLQKDTYDIADLIAIMRLLRSEKGCPWDKEQNHISIRMNVIEEAYEVAEAIDSGDSEVLREELGDLLLQVTFHAQIADDENEGYDFNGVCDGICKKLIYRHPHVFGELNAVNSDAVLKNWDILKSKSKGEVSFSDSFKNIPKLLPALMRGEKVGKRASTAGLDFASTDEVIKRLKEEIQELEFAVINKNDDEIEDEFGDILYTCCNLGRFLKKDSEKALTRAINKFIMRFRAVEISAEEKGYSLTDLSQSELDNLWEKSK